ncbi:carbohydrate ABC transporter permease [Cohnella zeiphila]|uniref:Carbohydrate ABC transporter permease n=1 Tax=Cohnella zeiphila TaxID=2761120 RepID=A0A7X0SL80_9BACL|nr:carbohydrate ABC transporter permease [Cohnella zeiphila]MBB6731944.1 carbohydrate ABC transporter permease [Cohnella zeiphila]
MRISHEKYKSRDYIMEIVLWILSLIILIPFYYLAVNTFKSPAHVTHAPMALPGADFSFSSYQEAWSKMNYPRVFINNLIYTGASVVLNLFVSSMAAYALVMKRTRFHRFIYLLFISSIMIPFQMLIIPLMRMFSDFHMMNTYQGVILVYVFTNISFVTFLYYSFVKTIPPQLEEAARMDGATVMQTFWRIYFPLLVPVTVTAGINLVIGFWNDFLVQVLFISKPEMQNITRAVFSNVGQFTTDWSTLLPMFMLSMLPLIVFFFFMQKYIVKGLVAGSVKG